MVGWKRGGIKKGGGKKGVLPFFGVLEIREVGKRGGWTFPPGPTKDHSPKLGGKFGEIVCSVEITILPFILFSCFLDTYYKNLKKKKKKTVNKEYDWEIFFSELFIFI